MSSRLGIRLSLIAVALAAAGVVRADPAGRTPEQARQALMQTARAAGFKAYGRQLGARQRVVCNVTAPETAAGRVDLSQLNAMAEFMRPGSDVVAVCHVKQPGLQHTLFQFDGSFPHLQTAHGHWRLNDWDTANKTAYWPGLRQDAFRPSQGQMVAALVQLTPAEAQNLRGRIQAAGQDQSVSVEVRAQLQQTAARIQAAQQRIRQQVVQANPGLLERDPNAYWNQVQALMKRNPELAQLNQQYIATLYQHSHLKAAFGQRGFNCTSGWSGLQIGERGETLAQLCGVAESSDPHGFQHSLEQQGNERVFGIAVFGSPVPSFGVNPNANMF
jgi:hypothetical protein